MPEHTQSSTRIAAIRCATDVLGPLVAGALVYVLWRPTTLRMFDWAKIIGLKDTIDATRTWVGSPPAVMPQWWIGAFPDGAWVYAWMAQLGLVWRKGRLVGAAPWMAIGPVLGIGSEVGQAFGLVPGRYSWADVLCMVAATALAAARVHRWRIG